MSCYLNAYTQSSLVKYPFLWGSILVNSCYKRAFDKLNPYRALLTSHHYTNYLKLTFALFSADIVSNASYIPSNYLVNTNPICYIALYFQSS